MKTTIIIEGGKVTIQVDDNAPVIVEPTIIPKKTNRYCEICHAPIDNTHRLARVCSDKCRQEKQRRYAKAQYDKKIQAKEPVADESELWVPKPIIPGTESYARAPRDGVEERRSQ